MQLVGCRNEYKSPVRRDCDCCCARQSVVNQTRHANGTVAMQPNVTDNILRSICTIKFIERIRIWHDHIKGCVAFAGLSQT